MTNSRHYTVADRIAQANLARDLVRDGVARYQRYRSRKNVVPEFYVTVEEDDELYDYVMADLIKTVHPDDQRSLIAESYSRYDNNIHEHRWQVVTLIEKDFNSELVLEGKTIYVESTMQKAGDPKRRSDDSPDPLGALLGSAPDVSSDSGAPNLQAMSHLTRRLVFTVDTVEDRMIVLRYLQEKLDSKITKRTPSFYIASSYGNWKRSTQIRRRPIDSVILGDGIRDMVCDDLRKFLAEEERYELLGLPWHHGYLFYGPPGTGKTSLAASLATEFEYDIYALPLSSIEGDDKLSEAMTSISSDQAMVVIEDVDIVHAARERDDKEKGVTLQGLLQALDGLATPHGLIVILTTNNRSVLDPALIRAGRVDVEIEIGYVTDDQLQGLCKRFLGRAVDVPRITSQFVPADVVGLFKDVPDEDVDDALRTFVSEQNDRVQTTSTEVS